jgi:hypothetical protein
MVFLKAQARIIESLLACLLISITLVFSNSYFLNSSIVSEKVDKKELASNALSFMLYNGILKEAYYQNYFSIAYTLEKIIPPEYGFKISIYDSSWTLIWSYQRSIFRDTNADSSLIILNGCDGLKSNTTLIFVLAVS